MSTVLIVGGGLTGCTVAHRLAQRGRRCLILERSHHLGGLIRSDHLEGVLYEPSGSHIFHTEDDEVWELADSLVNFRPYRHRVDIMVAGQKLNWPPLISQIERLPNGRRIREELMARRANPVDLSRRAETANFEEWCVELMGEDMYDLFIRPYTTKQWGRPPAELPATFAPSRISVRYDDDPYLFPDRHQGWPGSANGYNDLIEGLTGQSPLVAVRTNIEADANNIAELAKDCEAGTIVLTCPLDEFSLHALGRLQWRGILVESVFVPQMQLAQGAMVVNYPSEDVPFIRVHETKHASGQLCDGTVLGFEFTGAADRHYPIETAENKMLNQRYKAHLEATIEQSVFFAGRLANYRYIDMDDCMREALDCADQIAEVIPLL